MINRPRLAPCPQCRRHLRTVETICPFCSTRLGPDALSPRGPLRLPAGPRLGRAAIFAFSSAIATSGSGCYLAHERQTADVDAGPRQDAATEAADARSPLPDGASPDAHLSDAWLRPDGGEVALPPYGIGPFFEDAAVEPGDADTEDAGNVVNLYGAPPFEG